jgi:hypothetical protein
MTPDQLKAYHARLAEKKAELETKELLAKKKSSLSPEQFKIFLNNEILNTLYEFKTKEGKDNAKAMLAEHRDRMKKGN